MAALQTKLVTILGAYALVDGSPLGVSHGLRFESVNTQGHRLYLRSNVEYISLLWKDEERTWDETHQTRSIDSIAQSVLYDILIRYLVEDDLVRVHCHA